MNIGLLAAIGIGAYLLFKNNSAGVTELEQAWITKIKSIPEWYAAQVAEASVKGISIDEQLLASARWMISEGWTL